MAQVDVGIYGMGRGGSTSRWSNDLDELHGCARDLSPCVDRRRKIAVDSRFGAIRGSRRLIWEANTIREVVDDESIPTRQMILVTVDCRISKVCVDFLL